jgi:putative methyltransferase
MLMDLILVPNAQRVVYSTCSIFEEENEQVVEWLLENHSDFHLRTPFPSWKHRGLDSYSVGKYCIRASPLQDSANGFFVSCFERNTINSPASSEDPNSDDPQIVAIDQCTKVEEQNNQLSEPLSEPSEQVPVENPVVTAKKPNKKRKKAPKKKFPVAKKPKRS